MYAPTIFKMPERILPMERRNAMVSRRIENAQGLMLSIKAATATRGKSHCPSLLKPQSADVPKLPDLKNNIVLKNRTANETRMKNLLAMLRSNISGKPEHQGLPRIIFYNYFPLNSAYSRGSVRRRVKHDLNHRLC